jgi:hypothetical protein
MKTFKTTLALALAIGLNTAAFAQTTPGNTGGTMPGSTGGAMQTTPGATRNTNGSMQTTPGTMRTGTMQSTDGTMRNGTMQGTDGTMRTQTNSADRRMKTKGSMSNGKSKMKNKPVR